MKIFTLIVLGGLFPALVQAEEGWKFENETTLNASIVTGNSENISIGGNEKFTAKKKNITNVFKSDITYVRDDIFNDAIPAATSSRNISAKDKVLWNFHKKVYAFGGGGWLTNQNSGIDHQFDGFTGLGYKLLAREKQNLNIETGYQFEYQSQVAPFPDEGATQNALFGFDYLWKLTDKTSLENETEAILDMNYTDNVRVSSRTRLKVEIIKHLALTLGFKLQFDNNPVPTFKKLDTISTTGVTVSF